ncbi:MAG TPA: ATP-binding protein, partial [Thermoanaerobaculia bacterium]|nr:ATP-binding protein [Thermoanaerobaculia bacterium]
MKPLRFDARIRLAFLAAVLFVTLLAAAAVYWLPSPWAVLLAFVFGLPVGLWILDRVLTPAARVLQAVRDGVRGFRDHDFSLHLAVDRKDELGVLVDLYNSVGDVLREERQGLIQREMLLETVFEATPMAIVLTNARDRIVFANRSARELFFTRRRLEGQFFGQILAQCPEGLREALAGGQDSLFSLEQEGGEEEVFHVARRAFELNGQRHDLTLVKRLTPELRRQEVDVWKRAIRTLSHELNNSLAPIASLARSVRLIVRQPEHADRLDSALDVIEERATHLKEFLEGYARFARLPQPNKRTVEWGGFLAELRQVTPFELVGEPPGAPGRFDPGQMQQALINLLKNAHESGSPLGEVKLAVEPTGEGGVRFRVLDRGTGLSDEGMRKALLPFYTSKPGGSGLGLPLCREIVEAHGGR